MFPYVIPLYMGICFPFSEIIDSHSTDCENDSERFSRLVLQ